MILSGSMLRLAAVSAIDPTPEVDAASVDVHVSEDVRVEPHGFACVDAIEELSMPRWATATITGRSSHMQQGVTMPGGYVDPQFEGSFVLEFFNHSDEVFNLQKGEGAGRLVFFNLGLNRLEARFWSKVSINGIDECWSWRSAKNYSGYGEFSSPNDWSKLAHRVAWRLTYGEPEKPMILHTCDNPVCVNPGHLFEGDASDNAADMVQKNRHTGKLTYQTAEKIREKYEAGATQMELANEYDVTQTTISRVINRERYV